MRCDSCNKFVGYDDPQCEVGSVDLNDSSVHVSVTVQLNCADCGTTLKDAEIESEAEFSHECTKLALPNFSDGNDQFEVVSEGEAEGTDRLQTIDRRGKPIKSERYMKKFYGFTLEPDIKCLKCGEVFSVTVEGEEQASGFNEQ